jgi:glycerol kinase
MSFLCALDQGTTSTRAVLFDDQGRMHHTVQKELRLITPQSGWVEQDPQDIIRDSVFCIESVIAHSSDIQAIGVTNQRETTILWDRRTGKPLYNAIVWQDRRTAEFCAACKNKGFEPFVQKKTGLLLDPYFSATKIKWILDHVEGARNLAEQGHIAFGTIDTWVLWNLTKGQVHATDVTNASRTMLMSLERQTWDQELLDLFSIPRSLLPRIEDTASDFGTADLLSKALPVTALVGDQQAALIGQGCVEKGDMKSTYGTGCFALLNTGETLHLSQNKLLTTIAYRFQGKTHYALEGSIFVAGAAIQWLRDQLGLIADAQDTETLARSVDLSEGVVFVPAFAGLGAPYWNPDARAAIFGLSRGTGRAHIVRAALEAQAFQTFDLLKAMEKDTGSVVKNLRVDGGLIKNKFVAQHLADILNGTIEVPKIVETTALGAALTAGLGAGVFKSFADLKGKIELDQIYRPQMTDTNRQDQLKNWHDAVGRLVR